MLETTSKIEFKCGDSKTFRFEWIQAANNLPLPLTGCIANMDIVSLRGNAVAISLSSESSPPSITIDELNGIVLVFLSSIDTAELTPGEYKSDLQLTFLDGSVKSTNTFFLKVIEDVTKR